MKRIVHHFDPDRVLTIYPTMKKWLEDNNLDMITGGYHGFAVHSTD